MQHITQRYTLFVFSLFMVVLCAAGMFAEPVRANMFNKPAPPSVLSLEIKKDGETAQKISLDLMTLHAIGETSFSTETLWTRGKQVFTGVRLADFLKHFGITSGTVRIRAINDYAVEIPVAEALNNDALIAYERNGREMSLRDKGPLWIVYPYDSDSRYRSEVYYSRSIWQVTNITLMK